MTGVRRLRRVWSVRRDDGGSLAPAVPIIAVMFLLLAGLVIDSSRELTARARAVSYAEEAARAGASAVDPASEPLVLLPDEARRQARDYCAAAELREPRLQCSAPTVTGTTVTVHAVITLQAGLLGIVGISELHGSGDGTARPLIGVTEGDAQ
jgi:hypothetical protein